MRIGETEERGKHKGIWIFCEVANRQLAPVTGELLGAARRLAQQRPQPVWAVLFGSHVEHLCPALWAQGADAVLLVDEPELAVFHDEDQAALLQRLIGKYRPEIVLAGATMTGRALIPRVAVLAHCGLTADCTSLQIDPVNGALLQTRPAFGGNLLATIRSDGFLPQMATVRPGVMSALPLQPQAQGRVIREILAVRDRTGLKQVLEEIRAENAQPGLGNASFIIAGGRGMRNPQGFAKLRQLATLVGGTVGATRAAVDAGWVPYAMQIGQTGQTVQPKVYFACGVSGQIQHLVGMQHSDVVIAVNPDPDAPLMKLADIAVVGDALPVIDHLIDALRTEEYSAAATFSAS